MVFWQTICINRLKFTFSSSIFSCYSKACAFMLAHSWKYIIMTSLNITGPLAQAYFKNRPGHQSAPTTGPVGASKCPLLSCPAGGLQCSVAFISSQWRRGCSALLGYCKKLQKPSHHLRRLWMCFKHGEHHGREGGGTKWKDRWRKRKKQYRE